MTITNPDLLACFRTSGRCELCGARCAVREPAHVMACGRGGRLDCRINILSLGGPWDCKCHRAQHNGDTKYFSKFLAGMHGGVADIRRIMLLTVAVREHEVTYDIEAVLWWLRRLPKKLSTEKIDSELKTLATSARNLAVKTLREAGVMEDMK